MKRIQIETVVVIGRGDTDGLLDHSRLLRDARRLVVIRPGHGAARRAQNCRRMDGHVSLLRQVGFRKTHEIFRLHRDAVFQEFPWIDVFKNASLKQVRP